MTPKKQKKVKPVSFKKKRYNQLQSGKDQRISDIRKIQFPESNTTHYENEKKIEKFFKKKR